MIKLQISKQTTDKGKFEFIRKYVEVITFRSFAAPTTMVAVMGIWSFSVGYVWFGKFPVRNCTVTRLHLCSVFVPFGVMHIIMQAHIWTGF